MAPKTISSKKSTKASEKDVRRCKTCRFTFCSSRISHRISWCLPATWWNSNWDFLLYSRRHYILWRKKPFPTSSQEQLHGPKRTESGCWSKTIRQTLGIQPKMDNRLCISGSHAGKKGEKASKRRIRQGFCTKNLYDKTKNIKFVGKIVSDGWQW